MAAPWEKYSAPSAAPWTKYSAPEAEATPQVDNSGPHMPRLPNESLWDYTKRQVADAGKEPAGASIKRQLGEIGSNSTPVLRGIWKGVSSLPEFAQDLGVGGRNLLTGSNYELPSKMYARGIDEVAPLPNTPGAKMMEFGTSVLTGGMLPSPTKWSPSTQLAPDNFVKPSQDFVRQQTLANAQKSGYVVPPATTNPTITNKILESVGGKVATAQDAALKNQDITNTLAKRALGLSEDAPITQQSLAAVRKEAGDAYATLRQVGEVKLDDVTTKSLDEIASRFTGSKLKEVLGGGNDIPKIVQAIKDEPLNGSTAVDAIDLLRNAASKAYASGDKNVGKAYRALSETVEGLMEKNLTGDALKQFRDARQLIAKTYSVEGAFNPSTGNVLATKLAAQLTKGKPLSGDLLEAAKFGQAFPKAAQGITDSGAVRNTDVMMSAGTAALSKEPSWLMYPFVRQAMRAGLLSKTGQKLAVQSPPGSIPPELLMAAFTAAQQSRK